MPTTTNPLVAVLGLGQSVWYDNIRRSLIASGELARMIEEDGLRGVTSNPAIFENAITGSTDYVDAILELGGRGLDAKALFELLAIRDIQDAADALRSVYDESDRRDGYVSLEVAPTLANDTEGTVAEAVRLWEAVDRENLMIKVPATAAGIPAIRALIARSINVNVTLLFSTAAYEQVAEAYLAGLEAYAASGGDVSRVASVASFFVSRIDSAVDAELEARELKGKVAIANAKLLGWLGWLGWLGRGPARPQRLPADAPRPRTGGGLLARAPARHGRLEPGPGRAEDDVGEPGRRRIANNHRRMIEACVRAERNGR